MIIPLDQPLVVEISGSDAGKVLHNVTTNHVLALTVGASLETFVTDVRGWVVAHGLVFRVEEHRWWLLGQHPEPQKVTSHIDRYIIREDAAVNDLSSKTSLSVVEKPAGMQSVPEQADGLGSSQTIPKNLWVPFSAMGLEATLQVHIDGEQETAPKCGHPASEWEKLRISRCWPKIGQDVWEKCIPQELDRNPQAISFTKGCYLGQETIARLDALGQIQKKLALVKFQAPGVKPKSVVVSEEREVGQITSSVDIADSSLCLAVLKRGFFEPEQKLNCGDITGTVLPTPDSNV